MQSEIIPCFYIRKPSNDIGGPLTFLRVLLDYFKKKEIPFTHNPFRAKGLFFPLTAPFWMIWAFHLAKLPIIQRLDGVYYPDKHGPSYKKTNRFIERIYRSFSTHIVFQSRYSQLQCETMFGKSNAQATSLIYNGANRAIFYPSEKKFDDRKVQLLAVGKFRQDDMIRPFLDMLKHLDKERFTLTLVGSMDEVHLNEFLSYPNVKFHGRMNDKEIAEMHRKLDVFVFSHASAPCPNAVIEAVTSGLPVVSFDTGSMKELCGFNGDLLAETPDKIFHTAADLSGEKLAEKVVLCANHFSAYKEKSLSHIEDFTDEKCVEKYLDVLRTQNISEASLVLKNVLLAFFFCFYAVYKVWNKIRRVVGGEKHA